MNWYLLQIGALLLAIYFLSRGFIKSLFFFAYRVLRQQNAVVGLVSFFLLLGTFIHEVGHLLVAEFLGVPTADLNVIPKLLDDGSIQLGGVKVRQTDPVRRTIIGLAPVIGGLILIWVGTYFLQNWRLDWYWWLLYGYLLMQITLTMFSSPKDLEGAALGLALMGVLLFGLKALDQVIVFAPFLRFKELILAFFNQNLVYLRDGLFFGAVVNFVGGFLFRLLSGFRGAK